MSRMPTPDQDLRAQAADWVVRLHDAAPVLDGKPRAREDIVGQFKQWIQSSPQHAAAFLRVDDTFCRLAVLDPGHRIDVEDLHRQLGNETPADSRSAAAAPPRREAWSRLRAFAWAAAVLILLAGGLWWTVASRAPVYVTGVGEQLNVKLPDGSVMTLNTQTRVQVEFSAHTRNIRLTAGEALFEVEHDPTRPFIVTTATARVRAVGTRFDVYQHREADGPGSDTVVSVLEGVVQVALVQGDGANGAPQPAPAPPASIDSATAAADRPEAGRLAAGEQAKVSRAGMTHRVAPDVTEAVAWRQRELMFHGAPLSVVAAEYNRYNVTQIRIEDPEIGQRLMSGTYSADRPQLLVGYLQRDPSVSVTTRGTNWVIQKR